MENKEKLSVLKKPHIIIKCMEKKWIDEMHKYGNMRFSCPGKWVQYEIENGIGRGDKYEGTFAIEKNCRSEEKYKKKYGNGLIINHEINHTYYQLKKVLGSPVFCFYSLEDTDMEIKSGIEGEGIYDVEFTIPGEFFQDFAKGKGIAKEEIDKLPDDEKPAMLIIVEDNIYKFLDAVQHSLKRTYGLNDNNIVIEHVVYGYDRNGDEEFNCKCNHPKELLYKNIELKYQNEARIIVRSKKYRFHDYEKEWMDLNIGSMENYSDVVTGYYPEGIQLNLSVEVSKIGTIIEREGAVVTGYKKSIIDIEE